MIDSVVDTFTDATGIDAGNSTNEFLSSGAYSGGSSPTIAEATLSTANITTFNISVNNLASLINGSTTSQAIHTDSSGVGAWVKYDFGSAKQLSYWRYHLDSGLYVIWQLQYSDDNSSWTDAGSTFGGHPTSSATWYSSGDVSGVGSHRYWRSYKTDSAGVGNYHQELDIFTSTPNIADLTLQSTATTAETTPTTGDIVMLLEDAAGTATINTDIKAYISRDGGTTWTQGTLTDEGGWGTNKKVLAFHNLDISAQPSGTSMKYKITTHNQSASKETRVHATSLAWA
jgi:hypothetical protein